MRGLVIIALIVTGSVSWWLLQTQPNDELAFKSSDPSSPQSVGIPPKEINSKGPAPKLFVEPTNATLLKPQQKTTTAIEKVKPQLQPVGPQVFNEGQVNPDAVEYYRKRGYLGADQETLALMKSQHEIWHSKSDQPLHFEQVGGGLSLDFELDPQGMIKGAIVEMSGGGAGARLMSAEMWMTGNEKPWDLYWETQAPGPIAGTVPIRDGEEVHYYCDMNSMDEAGSLNEPTRCHFRLNEPTIELQAYLSQPDARPIQKAKSRIEP